MSKRASAAAAVLALATGWASAQSLVDAGGIYRPLKPLSPAESSVAFSSRFGQVSALATAQSFGATRLEWSYVPDGEAFIREARARGFAAIGATINSSQKLSDPRGYVTDLDGNPIAAPWMKTWGVYWNTTANADVREHAFSKVRAAITAGATSIQVDDPQFQYFASSRQGGDFSDDALKGLTDWLGRQADKGGSLGQQIAGSTGGFKGFLAARGVRSAQAWNALSRTDPAVQLMQRYAQASVLDFHAALRNLVTSAGDGRVTISMNLGPVETPTADQPMAFLAGLPDYSLSELSATDAVQHAMVAQTFRNLGMRVVGNFAPANDLDGLWSVAHMYAHGIVPVVPWDVYAGNDKDGRPTRFFGDVATYSPYFRFVRKHAPWFDGTESAPVAAILYDEQKSASRNLRSVAASLVNAQVPFAYVARSHASAEALAKFRLVVSCEPECADLPSLPRTLATAPRFASPRELATMDLSVYRPFVVAPSIQNVVIREASDRTALLVHLIDRMPRTGDCRRRFGLKNAFVAPYEVSGASVASPETGAQDLKVEASSRDDSTYVTIDTCSRWSVLRLALKKSGA